MSTIDPTVFQGLLSLADDGVICVDGAQTITFFNEGAERMFGYRRADILGQPLVTLIPQPVQHRHDQLVARFGAAMETSRRIAERADVSGRRADGTIFPAQVSIVQGNPDSFARFAAIVRDVTRERAYEQSLEKSLAERSLLSAAINETRSSVTIVDALRPDYPLIYVSDAFQRLTGYSREEALGQNCRFLQGPDTDLQSRQTLWSAIEEGRSCRIVLSNYTKDGRHFWNRLEISPIRDAAGAVIAFVGIQSDVTEERRRDQAVAETQRMEALGTMAGNIAHEINNWLQPALAARSLLTPHLRVDSPAELQPYLGRLEEASLHIRSIVLDVLNFARGNEREPLPDLLPLRAVLEAAIRFAAHIAPEGIHIAEHFELSDRVSARLSKIGLTQIVTNLITNATHAMSGAGQVRFAATLEAFDPARAAGCNVAPGMFCRLEVTDTGTGFSPEILKKAFEPFITSHRITGGTGLGLSVVRGIVTSWGGFAEAQNAPSGGAQVTLYFPVTLEPEN